MAVTSSISCDIQSSLLIRFNFFWIASMIGLALMALVRSTFSFSSSGESFGLWLIPVLKGLTREPLPDVYALIVDTGFGAGCTSGPAVMGQGECKSVQASLSLNFPSKMEMLASSWKLNC
jgi:hypothetical protein